MLVLGTASIFFMSLSALIAFVIQRRHLLMSLLALEALILTLVLMMLVSVSEMELYFMFVLVTFGACEASLGLSCLVVMMRSYGNDRIKALTSIKC